MAVNPRVSLVIDNNPTIIWAEVPTATSYTLKIIRKNSTEKPIFDKTVCVNDLIKDGSFLKFMYPSEAPRLEPSFTYKFTGRTDDGKRASGYLVFLDLIRADINVLIAQMKDPNVVTDQQILEKFRSIVEKILAGSGDPGPWLDGGSCFLLKQFT